MAVIEPVSALNGSHPGAGWPLPVGRSPGVDDLFADGNGRWVASGMQVMVAGEEIREVALLRAGEVRLRVPRSDQGPGLVSLVRPGGTIGDQPVLAGRTVAVADAFARSDAQLTVLSTSEFLRRVHSDPRLALEWLRWLNCCLEQRRRHAQLLASKDLRQQVAAILLLAREQRPQGREVAALSQGDIGELVGARRPSITQVVKELREAGLVRTGYSCLEILDFAGLAEVAGDLGEPTGSGEKPPAQR